MFEDATFSYDRLKLSFISSLNFWADSFPDMYLSIVRIFLCILSILFFVVAPFVYPCVRLGYLFGSLCWVFYLFLFTHKKKKKS